MKKYVILFSMLTLVAFMATAVYAQGTFEFKGGVDLGGKLTCIDGSVSDTVDVSSGYFAGVEYLVPYTNNLTLGGGLKYQFDREITETAEKFHFMPIYALVRYNLKDRSAYLIGHLGYNSFSVADAPTDAEIAGGLYYGGGIGVKLFKNVKGEALYTVNNGTIKYGGDTLNYRYGKLSLGFSAGF